ncbi:19906_t:CDS:1, partial [Gigaspora margarita]
TSEIWWVPTATERQIKVIPPLAAGKAHNTVADPKERAHLGGQQQ